MKFALLGAPMLLLASVGIMASDFNGNADRGEALYGVCSGCHGVNAEGNAAIKAPRLAGQFEWYLVTQLKNFKSGARGSAEGDAGGAVMAPMSQTLIDDQAIDDVVAYIMTLDAEPYEFKQ